MEIEFHHFDYSRELTLQRELFRECFPETIGLSLETVDHYLWKFHSKGGASKSMEYSAYLNNKLVGYYAAIPLSYKFLDKSLSFFSCFSNFFNSIEFGRSLFKIR